MRPSSHIILFTLLATFVLSSCANNRATPFPTQMAANFIHRQSITTITDGSYPSKNPTKVALYSEDKSPHAPYRIIGVAKVSKVNLLGMQRQEKTVEDMMKKLAASIGGDGLININNQNDHLEASVIAFQKILI